MIAIPEYIKIKSFSGIVFILLLFLLIQCRPTSVVTSIDDSYSLDPSLRFEYEYYLHEGLRYKLQNDIPRAYYFFSRCLEIDPKSAVANYELSKVYFIAGEIDSAVKSASNAIEIDPHNIWYYHNKAGLLINSNDLAGAAEVYTQAFEMFPNDAETGFSLAALLSAAGKFDNAIEVYSRLEELLGADERVYGGRYDIYYQIGKFEKAYNELQILIEFNPYDPRYYGMLAELYSSIDMEIEALETYDKLFELEPNHGPAQLSIAEFYLERGNILQGFEFLERAFKNPSIDPADKTELLGFLLNDPFMMNNHSELVLGLSEILREYHDKNEMVYAVLTDYYLRNEDYTAVSQLLFKLYEADKQNFAFADQLISSLAFGSDFELLIETSEANPELFNRKLFSSYFLGVAYSFVDSAQKAIETFNRVIEFSDVNEDILDQVYTYLGDLYHQVENQDLSDFYYQKAIAINSKNLIALNNYAYYLSLRGENLELAKEYSFITISEEPQNASFLDTYAWVLYGLEDFEEALKYIEKAYRYSPDRYEIVKHYGLILIRLDKRTEALDFFKEARELTEDKKEIDSLILNLNNKY